MDQNSFLTINFFGQQFFSNQICFQEQIFLDKKGILTNFFKKNFNPELILVSLVCVSNFRPLLPSLLWKIRLGYFLLLLLFLLFGLLLLPALICCHLFQFLTLAATCCLLLAASNNIASSHFLTFLRVGVGGID